MKSLELINEMLNYPFEERILTELATNETIIREEELKQIKQDLEVLEIIRKYLYYIDHTIKLKSISKSVYNFDYEKLKQWLEVNENA